MERVIFAAGQGEGLICTEPCNFDPATIELESENLTPGVYTSLGELHTAPMRFMGSIPGEPGSLVFHLGDVVNLFGTRSYYAVYHFLSPTRLFRMYAHGSGRDYNWVNGKWK